MQYRKVVVIAPIKNENWILASFLRACSQFADHIILGDHFSSDNSTEIAKSFPKVKVIQASSEEFDEMGRRNQLLIEARKLGKGNLIFSLDADEFLSKDLGGSRLLEIFSSHPEGTHFKMPFFNVSKDLKSGWNTYSDPIAFVDDGSLHTKSEGIHFPRLPTSEQSQVIEVEQLSIIHLQYVDWMRMESKHRWYKAWERVNFPNKPAIEIFRRYNHMNSINPKNFVPLPDSWILLLESHGVFLRDLAAGQASYWWDSEVEELLAKNPARVFRHVFKDATLESIPFSSRLFFWYAETTQYTMRFKLFNPIRLVTRFLDRLIFRYWI